MNLLVTGAWQCGKEELDALRTLENEVYFLQREWDDLPVPPEQIEGVICNGLFLYHPIEKFTNLRYIQLTSAGFDRVPMEYVRSHGIRIHNARGVYSIPMAEYAISGVLQLYKQSRFFAEKQRQGSWEKRRDLMELYEKKVCIIGCGSVGNACAQRFSAFGCTVTGVDLFPREDAWYARILPLESLDDVLSEMDVVVLTLPLTEQTRHLMDKERLSRLKHGAVLVNIARGAIIDQEALTNWLRNGSGAAVLDVFEEEPLSPDSPLWQMENVILTPHNSFVGDGNADRLQETVLRHLREN